MHNSSYLGLSPHGFHRVAYTQWGDGTNPRALVCAHGLTRNGRDFDFLAAALQDQYRIVCPDVVGRGQSDWLTHKSDYNYLQYLADMNALIARLDMASIDWVGTSMGGLIGMMLAAQPNTPIRKLVMNDVGPFIPKSSLERLATYVGKAPSFASIAEAEFYVRTVSAGFGALTPEQWRHLTEHSVKSAAGGGFVMRYDPGIAEVFAGAALQDVNLWPIWSGVRCPVLLIRGAESDLLLRETALQMQSSRAGVTLVEIAQAGHAPALMDRGQIDIVREFLLH
jgi:pimeloyl-ACP methyl ester carboxylesterase